MAVRRFLLDEALLDVDDLVRILCLPSRRALYNRLHRGTVPPPIRVGSSLRWRPEEVSLWLETRQDEEVGA
jgi:predicted DNA-binding transcriptional regulator AlpA